MLVDLGRQGGVSSDRDRMVTAIDEVYASDGDARTVLAQLTELRNLIR